MTVKIRGQQDATQIGVPIEYNAHKIVSFAFVPIGRSPKLSNCRDMRIVLGKQHFQTQSVMMLRAKQVIVDLETRIVLRPPIRSAKIGEHVKTVFLF